MSSERVPLNPRQWSAVALLLVLLVAQFAARALGAPGPVVVVLVIATFPALVLAVVVLVLPLRSWTGR